MILSNRDLEGYVFTVYGSEDNSDYLNKLQITLDEERDIFSSLENNIARVSNKVMSLAELDAVKYDKEISALGKELNSCIHLSKLSNDKIKKLESFLNTSKMQSLLKAYLQAKSDQIERILNQIAPKSDDLNEKEAILLKQENKAKKLFKNNNDTLVSVLSDVDKKRKELEGLKSEYEQERQEKIVNFYTTPNGIKTQKYAQIKKLFEENEGRIPMKSEKNTEVAIHVPSHLLFKTEESLDNLIENPQELFPELIERVDVPTSLDILNRVIISLKKNRSHDNQMKLFTIIKTYKQQFSSLLSTETDPKIIIDKVYNLMYTEHMVFLQEISKLEPSDYIDFDNPRVILCIYLGSQKKATKNKSDVYYDAFIETNKDGFSKLLKNFEKLSDEFNLSQTDCTDVILDYISIYKKSQLAERRGERLPSTRTMRLILRALGFTDDKCSRIIIKPELIDTTLLRETFDEKKLIGEENEKKEKVKKEGKIKKEKVKKEKVKKEKNEENEETMGETPSIPTLE